jgi:hypothetical protein
MKIDLDEIERCAQVLIAHARKRGLTSVDASDVDMYWTTTDEDWFVQVSGTPTLAVGSLSDDIAELKQLADDPKRATIVDLDRLASVIRLMSCQLSRAS